MEYKDLQSKSEPELIALIGEERAKLQGLKLKRSMNQLKDVREIREVKKAIARMETKISSLRAQK